MCKLRCDSNSMLIVVHGVCVCMGVWVGGGGRVRIDMCN